MAKKQQNQPKQDKKPSTEVASSSLNPNTSQKLAKLRQRQLTQFIHHPNPQQTKNLKRSAQAQLEPLRKQSINSAKEKGPLPMKMKKKISKKKKGKSKSNQVGGKGGVKLQRGYKFCQNCQTILNIHKYVCTECGFVHNMKKHKLDVMKNLSKGTPKIVKSIIEANEFNVIKLIPSQQNNLYPASFEFKSGAGKEELPQLQIRRSQQNELKRAKSQSLGGQKLHVTRGKSQSSHQGNDLVGQQNCKRGPVSMVNCVQKIIFRSLQINQVTLQSNPQKKYNKTREQFSVYQSPYPITVMESMQIEKAAQFPSKYQQYLLFGQLVSKKEVFNNQNEIINGFAREDMDEIESFNSQSEQVSQQMNYQKKNERVRKETKDSQRNKTQSERIEIKKQRQRNTITEKALGLGKFHRLGALYQGQTIINLMKVSTQSKGENQNQEKQNCTASLPGKSKRRSSGRFSKPDTQNQDTKNVRRQILQGESNSNHENEHDVVKIGLKQHVEMMKSINNKVAILTGKKSILLMNVNLEDGKSFYAQTKTANLSQSRIIQWLSPSDFHSQKSEILNLNKKQPQQKKYLGKISLSHHELPTSDDDKFIVIEWLKLYSQFKSNKANQQLSYLATGTLHGHIVIYSVSPENSFVTYRTIIGAHFELINCIKQCPLNAGGTSLFASASFDGSVKVWDLQHKATICDFQVSNRKIQQIHWDSGAKFLVVVRDQGLQNCYLACFYSVNNRAELPIMLTDTIDFRMIRNGVLFENSCSPLIAFPLNSKLIVMINAKNGFFKIIETEEMRKTSLKRKKSKKHYQQSIYHDYWIRSNLSKNLIQNQPLSIPKQIQKVFNSNNPYQVIQMMGNFNQGIYMKLGLTSVPQVDHQQLSQNVLSPVQQSENPISEELSQILEKKVSEIRSKKQNHKVTNYKRVVSLQPVQNVCIRKSLRARKPNIQYNFIEEEEPQQEKPKKPASKKKLSHKRSVSDSEQSFDDAVQSSESEASGSSKSFVQSRINYKIQNHQKVAKGEKNSKQKHKNKKLDSKTQKKDKNLSQNQPFGQKQCEKNEVSHAQELLCKLFWQQTNEQSLLNQKDDYPANRFPKFSSIISFVTSSEGHRKAESLQKKDNVATINTSSIKPENQKNGKRKNRNHIKSKKSIDHEQMSEEHEINASEVFSGQSSSYEQENSQNLSKEKMGISKKGSKKKQPAYNTKKHQQKQSISQNCEYVTTFIAGYEGQLIKARIRVQGYQKFHESELPS